MPSEFPGRQDAHRERGRQGQRGGVRVCGTARKTWNLQHFMQIVLSAFCISTSLASFVERRFNFGDRRVSHVSKFPMIMCKKGYGARTWLCLSGSCLFSCSFPGLILLQFLGNFSVSVLVSVYLPVSFSLALSLSPLLLLLECVEMAFKIGK